MESTRTTTTSHRWWLTPAHHPPLICERMHVCECACVHACSVCVYMYAQTGLHPLLIHLIRGNRPQTRGISLVFDLLLPSPLFPFHCLKRNGVFSAHINTNWVQNVGRATANCPLWNLVVFADTPEQWYRRDWGTTCRAGTDWGLIYPPYETPPPPPPPYSAFPLLPFLCCVLFELHIIHLLAWKGSEGWKKVECRCKRMD